MSADDFRRRLTELLGFAVPPAPDLVVRSGRPRGGYVERLVTYQGDEGDVPALLLVPDRPCGAGVVVHHQHHGQWRFGKSEVAGLCGHPWQAFGPALARRGMTVIAPDAVGFEDRMPGGPGLDARASDATDYYTTMCYRLLRGRPLMCTVLADTAAAHSALAECDDVDETRIGALGHSMGGASVLLHAALDQRIAFAAVSGSACTYRDRIARGVGVDCAQAIPGLLVLGDLDDIVELVSPRPLLLCSADEDEYSLDAPRIAQAAAGAYQNAGAPQALKHDRAHGGHALTQERFDAIVDWVTAQLSKNASIAGRSTMTSLASWLRPPGWPALPDTARGRVRILASFAIAAQVFFIAGWIIGGLLQPGYSPVRSYISELARVAGCAPWIFDLANIVWGAGFIALALALLPVLRTRPWAHVAPSLFALAGFFVILLAPLRLQCAQAVDRACRARELAGTLPWHHYAHNWLVFGVQLALLATPFVLARCVWPSRLSRLLLGAAIVLVLFLAVAFLLGFGDDGYDGLWQRTELLIVHGWVLLCATALIIEASPLATMTISNPVFTPYKRSGCCPRDT